MKNIKFISVLIFLGVALILVLPHVKIADSGFDSSYGGGGGYSSSDSSWGGSSSYDYDYDYSYSGGGSADPVSGFFLFICVIVIIIFYIADAVSKDKQYNVYKNNDKKPNTLNDVQVKNTLSKIKEVYPNTDEESIINDALKVYKEYTKCINERDLDSLKTITDDTFFERIKELLEKYKTDNSYSIEEDIELKKGFIEFLDFYNNELTAKVVLNVEELQYFVDKNNKYLRGNKEERELTPYQITFKKTLGANKTILTNKVLCTNSEYIINDKDEKNFGSSLNMDILLNIDPSLNEDNIIRETYKKYEELQYAWSNFDYDKMRTLISDELYNNYRMQLRTLSSKKQKNIMEDITFVRGSVKSYEITENSINIKVELVVKQNDYIIDENNNIIKGDRIKDNNTYELLITRAISSRVRSNNCPNCGGELTGDASQTCAHCGSPLITLSKDFVIAKKKILYQR